MDRYSSSTRCVVVVVDVVVVVVMVVVTTSVVGSAVDSSQAFPSLLHCVGSVVESLSVQSTPPFSASTVTVYVRNLMACPQLDEQLLHSDQLPTQSTTTVVVVVVDLGDVVVQGWLLQS